MLKEIILLFILMLSQLYLNISNADKTVWEKIKDRNGISIYIINNDTSGIIKVRTSTIINASISNIQNILENYQQRTAWVPYLKHSRLLQSLSDNIKIEYAHFDAPWPASDRDFIYRMSRLDTTNNSISYAMKSETLETIPDMDSIIRATLIEGQYSLNKLEENRTKVDLVFHADLKGWLPLWVINIVQKALPYRMLLNLKALAEKNTVAKAR
ncbi:MAG: START domain-containing protein [Gammaproteobacteria bacterium]|nr:START domain-containing protein [Gammaproteobacteria bacterium]